MRATRAIIHLDHLLHNIDTIRTHTGGRPKVCLAVKADAYGHGIPEIGKAAERFGVDYLAVATADEGIELREAGVSVPIILYSLPVPPEIPAIVEYAITPMVSDQELARLFQDAADSQGRRLEVHLKIDTGMGRIGCPPDDALDLARMIADSPSLALGGVATHFAAADTEDGAFTRKQTGLFESALGRIRGAGIDPGVVNAANSGGVLAHPETWYDMIRPGILAYGYYPSSEQPRVLDIKPVMELRSQVVFIKELPAGEPVSYGMTWRAPHHTHIGTIPIGYGDGLNRRLSNTGEVLIDGARYPIVGRVCMDQIMVDLGPVCAVNRFDDVVIFGPDDGAPTAEDISRACGTIPYEVTCAITRRVPRVYRDEAQSANI